MKRLTMADTDDGVRRVYERLPHALEAREPVATYQVGEPAGTGWTSHWVEQPLSKVRPEERTRTASSSQVMLGAQLRPNAAAAWTVAYENEG